MVHSEKLEETVLWRHYHDKLPSNDKRGSWVKEIYEAASKYLMDVRLTFQNYTLHDETHILNVLDAIGGLLGDQVKQLTVGEMELLIVSTCLHDLGMVYTNEEKQRYYEDEVSCRKFLMEYCPESLGCPVTEWSEETKKWYLRTLHPFRLPDILKNEAWKEIFDGSPLNVVPKRCIIAVCQAHGEKPEELSHNRDLEYLSVDETDPLFCALLLRLGDLLDFDDTRAPRILYHYVVYNDKSRSEWDKHQASAGFRYPASPSLDDLPYKARCLNPGIEHAVRDFLDWVDEELGTCKKLQKRCRMSWQQEFPFPRAVLRDEIESEGYMSGDFCLTMDQTQVLSLLTGENLYDNRDVFVRELLQNAIDATLLRGEMDSSFVPEKARIDLWEWNDKEGNVWFRIDDQGTGMTLGMLQRYFLKVGNSYYNSRELERDLLDHGKTEKYDGISRFGIGFLSSFLCGNYAEVSTLYFHEEKNRRETAEMDSYHTIRYGLRLQVTGLSGYYTLKNQAKYHATDGQLPAPDGYDVGLEREGYRGKPGTSIVIRLEPAKLGTLNLKEAAEKYLCGARMPVYYNNKKIGYTYEELMQAVHQEEGMKLYELTPKMKEEFDRSFPAVRGQYPKLAVTVIPLDTEENQALPGMSGFFVKYKLQFDHILEWKVKDQVYTVEWDFPISDYGVVWLKSNNKRYGYTNLNEWERLKKKYDKEKVAVLGAEFEKHSVCPKEKDILEMWEPFSEQEKLYEVWVSYHDMQQISIIKFSIVGFECPEVVKIYSTHPYDGGVYGYQGIVAGHMEYLYEVRPQDNSGIVVFFMESPWKPMVDVSRLRISGLPLPVSLLLQGILHKYELQSVQYFIMHFKRWNDYPLKEWVKIKELPLDQWLHNNFADLIIEIKQSLPKRCIDAITDEVYVSDCLCYSTVLQKYFMVHFQNKYRMEISYEDGQVLSFYKKAEDEMEDTYDLFPPMMFCMAASDRSRQYICSADSYTRRGITADHPFVVWLLNYAVQLLQYYERQFQQMVHCLIYDSVEDIIQECNKIREQLLAFPERHGIKVSSFPQLSMDDFWSVEKMIS